jgi:uncharacterized RDD family membrane protein YckC
MHIQILHIFKQNKMVLHKLRPANLRQRIFAQLIDGIFLGTLISFILLLFSKGKLFSLWISPLVPIYIVQPQGGYIADISNWWWGGYFFKTSLPVTADFYLTYPSPLHWIIYCSYYVLFHYYFGQTPGKMIKGLVVQSSKRTGLTFKQAVLRWLICIAAVIPFGIGFWKTSSNKNKQAWHDQISNTLVYSFLDLEN